MGKLYRIAFSAAVLTGAGFCRGPVEPPLVYPEPRDLSLTGRDFVLDETILAVPEHASGQDLFLARSLSEEIGDRFGLHLKTLRLAALPADRKVIVLGSVSNPLVRAYCSLHGLKVTPHDPGPEGYILRSNSRLVLVAGSDDRGAFYGLQSLRQLLRMDHGVPRVPGVAIRDWPDKPFRGIKLFLPGRGNIAFFKRFVRDFMALYKYNTLIMEMTASMRLDRHPELNWGWREFARDTTYSRRNYPPGIPHEMEQNATHQDVADGDILEKEEVADLARWVRRYHIELIPELPSFTHAYYLLSAHKELSEVPGEKWPDTYCPSNPESYKLLFDVFDEYIEVLNPRMVHTGHDELFIPLESCPRCRGKDIGERYGEDVRRNYAFLARKGIRMAIWGDMLLEDVRGRGPQPRKAPDGWAYRVPGGMTAAQVERWIPKDVLIFNWFWGWKQNGIPPERYEAELDRMGFRQIYGNFTPEIDNYEARKRRQTLLGGAPSAWFAASEFGFGKDVLSDFLGCGSILWNGAVMDGARLSGVVQALLPEIRARLHGEYPPSRTEPSLAPVRISASFNTGGVLPQLGVDLRGMEQGGIRFGRVPFDLAAAGDRVAIAVGTDGREKSVLPRESPEIPIGQDATSIVFLHASARPAANREMFRLLWDVPDTADLLGWYEVTYEDGFVATIPVRYGVNIQEWSWAARQSGRDYCYGADAVRVGGSAANPITFFAFEWKNPRMGKVIRKIALKGTSGFRGGSPDFTNDYGPVVSPNAILLKAISVVGKRT